MKTKGLNSEQTKRSNRLLVLRLLSMMGGGSRTELTGRVHLAKMTVSNITAELLQSGILYEKETLENTRHSAGRRQMLLSFSEKAPAVIGVWVSRDSLTGIVTDPALAVLGRHTLLLKQGETAETFLEKLERLCKRLAEGAQGRTVLGIGIASIGPLDVQNGMLLNPPNFFGIRDLPLGAELEKRLGIPVFLENDTNAGALAEKYFGSCVDCSDFLYVGLTNGISAGIVLRDTLLHGAHGFAGEIGHAVVNPDGPLCYCGRRGCLETRAAVPYILRDAQEEFGEEEVPDFAALCNLCRMSPQAENWLAGRLSSLTRVLLNLSNTLDPEKILIGHEGALLPDRVLARMEEELNAGILAAGHASVKVERSSFDCMAAVYGAAAVVLRKVFDGKLGYEIFFPAS